MTYGSTSGSISPEFRQGEDPALMGKLSGPYPPGHAFSLISASRQAQNALDSATPQSTGVRLSPQN
jgi:hypothetical protein